MKATTALTIVISLFAFTLARTAPPPPVLNHQSRIAVGGVNFNGTGYFKFALLNPDTLETFWTNDGSNTGRPGGEPARAVPVAVASGHYSILLGDTKLTNMTEVVPASLFETEDTLALRVWFATRSSGPFELLSPDRRLTPAPYALHAAKAEGVTDGSITSAMLADGSVTGAQLADGTVTVADLATEPSFGPGVITINNPVPSSEDRFGWSVAGVGADKLLIGAYNEDTGGIDVGSAYLFDTSGTLLTTINNPFPDPGGSDQFGWSVAGVGTDKLLIGAPFEDTNDEEAGSVYLFNTAGTLLATINNPDPDFGGGDLFGFSIAGVGNDKLLVGAPGDNTGASDAGSAYLFDTAGTLLATINNPTPASNERFGSSVAAVGTDKLLIGAWVADTGGVAAGAVYLFDLTGTLLTTINNPDPASGDRFGHSVAAVGADKVLIGTYGDDTGASDAGSAYLFDTAGTLLATINNPDPESDEFFGISVAAVGNDRLLIGASRDNTGATEAGSAYIFDTAGNLLTTLNNPDPAVDDLFGYSVTAVGSDKLLIGAYGDDTGASRAGSAYLFPQVPSLPSLISGGVIDGAITATDLAPGASDDADADPTNEFQSLSLFNDILSISNGNSVSLTPYLRSNTSDIYAGGTLFVGTGATLSALGKFELTGDTSTDNDAIYFDFDPQETLTWVDSQDRFEFSNNLKIDSGGTAPQLRLEQTSASNFARLELATVDGGRWQIAAQGGANGDLRFYNGSANRMVLEDNGDLFIDGSLNPPSDRDKKENFQPVDPAEVLQKVAAMPIARWNYKHDRADTPHLGPVAQDFYKAFALGTDDKHIATVDADGVALAAIQALKAENDAKSEEIERLNDENRAILERLEAIEELLKPQAKSQP
jgi:hypothetical protein